MPRRRLSWTLWSLAWFRLEVAYLPLLESKSAQCRFITWSWKSTTLECWTCQCSLAQTTQVSSFRPSASLRSTWDQVTGSWSMSKFPLVSQSNWGNLEFHRLLKEALMLYLWSTSSRLCLLRSAAWTNTGNHVMRVTLKSDSLCHLSLPMVATCGLTLWFMTPMAF